MKSCLKKYIRIPEIFLIPLGARADIHGAELFYKPKIKGTGAALSGTQADPRFMFPSHAWAVFAFVIACRGAAAFPPRTQKPSRRRIRFH